MKLQALVQRNQFFELSNRDQLLLNDGSSIWVVEAYEAGRFHAAWCYLGSKEEIYQIANLAAEIIGVTIADLPLPPPQ